MAIIPPNIYIALGVMNNLEVIQSLQEGGCRQYANAMSVLLQHTQILVPLWGRGARANSHFPDAKFLPPPQPTSSHHRDYGASLDALCLVPLPTHPWMERAKGILPPYTWSPHKDSIV